MSYCSHLSKEHWEGTHNKWFIVKHRYTIESNHSGQTEKTVFTRWTRPSRENLWRKRLKPSRWVRNYRFQKSFSWSTRFWLALLKIKYEKIARTAGERFYKPAAVGEEMFKSFHWADVVALSAWNCVERIHSLFDMDYGFNPFAHYSSRVPWITSI